MIPLSSEEESESEVSESVQSVPWDVDMEIQLFYAMANLKPIGINKHFNMVCIWEKLSNSITKEISTHDIWKHLETLYDLTMLEDTEPIPFPNDEVHFSLPESEFGALIKQKCKEVAITDDSEEGQSPSPKPSTFRSGSKGNASKENTSKGRRKDSVSALASVATKSRKESGSSHASTDTHSVKSEKDYDRRRDSRDSNASGARDSLSTSRKSTSQRDRLSKSKAWDSAIPDDESGRRGRRRPNTSTPPAIPAKRRRT